jgi:hypothetical protein
MKNLMILMAVLVVAVVLLTASCKDSSREQASHEDSDTAKEWYEMSEERFTFEQILGASLPESATDKGGFVDFKSSVDVEAEQSFWLVATLPKEDFLSLVETLNLERSSDLLRLWPDAFACDKEEFANRHWDVDNSVNDDTYYGDHPTYRGQLAMKYENGRLYFRKVIMYDVETDDDGSTVYRKSKR